MNKNQEKLTDNLEQLKKLVTDFMGVPPDTKTVIAHADLRGMNLSQINQISDKCRELHRMTGLNLIFVDKATEITFSKSN